MLCGVHNHWLDRKLVDHPIVIRLDIDEKKIVDEMTTNIVLPKNMLKTLK